MFNQNGNSAIFSGADELHTTVKKEEKVGVTSNNIFATIDGSTIEGGGCESNYRNIVHDDTKPL